MKIDLKLDNHGVVNIGENVQNTYFGNTIFQEIHILKEHCNKDEDKEKLDEIVELLKKNETKGARGILRKLGAEVKDLIQDLSLTLLKEFLKDNI